MVVFLALLTALAYGVGDFSGGMAARRASPLTVTATAHLIGLCGLVGVAAIVGAEAVRTSDLVRGGVAGIFGCIGVLLLYRGLAAGVMAIVSPVSAVVAAAVPVIWGLAAGERPGAAATAGIAVALIAVWLVSHNGPMGRPDRSSLLVAVGSGLGFGGFFILLSGIGDSSGLWPLAVGRVTSVAFAAALALSRAVPVIAPRYVLGLAMAAGVLDVTANITFLLATQEGLLSIVAVIASLYPVATVVLAIAVTHERLSAAQGIGLVMAGGALVLIAV
jgi:drug/metabolite transporter (DMT)-like permease